MSESDQQLMQRVAGGDLEAFGELVARHQQMAWRVAYRMLGDSAEAEDAVQQAFLKILSAAPRYRPTGKFRSYLCRVLTRHCLDRLDKKKPIYTDDVPAVEDREPGPVAKLERRQRRRAIQQAVEKLPTRQRTAIILYHFEDLSYREIAESMEISVKAVESLLARGRALLNRQLGVLVDREII